MSLKATGLILLASLFCLVCALVAQAQSASSKPPSSSAQTDTALQELVNRAARDALSKFKDKNFQEGNLAITLIDLTDQQHPRQASFRGGEGIYPASVVKLFYLVMAHHLLEEGKIKETNELRRAMKDMIVDWSNDVKRKVLDVVPGTTAGAELMGAEFTR